MSDFTTVDGRNIALTSKLHLREHTTAQSLLLAHDPDNNARRIHADVRSHLNAILTYSVQLDSGSEAHLLAPVDSGTAAL